MTPIGSDSHSLEQRSTHSSLVVLAAPLAGVAAAVAQVMAFGVSPVGHAVADLVWTAALGLIGGSASARAPLWTVVGAVLISMGFIGSPLGVLATFVALIATLVVVNRRGWSPSIATTSYPNRPAALTVTVCVAGGLVTATLSLQDYGIPLISATAAIAIWSLVVGAAISRLGARGRLLIVRSCATAAVAAACLGALAAWDLHGAYRAAATAEQHLQRGLSEVNSGELGAATDSLSRAANSFERVVEPFSSPFVTGLRYAPVSGPNVAAAQSVLNPANNAIAIAHDALERTGDFDSLLGNEGLEIDEVTALATAVDDLLVETRQLRASLHQDRMWILPPLQRRLDAVAQQMAEVKQLPEASVAEGVSGMLGAEDQRSYLVLFGNTAEARELGGFTGGTALITIDDGALSLESADRPIVINENVTSPNVFTSAVPQRFLEHRPWLFSQNYSAMADFPTLAHSLRDLYPHMGGQDIDGVVYLDPQTLAALIGLVGEVHLENADLTVTAENVGQLVTIGQYDLAFETRSDREDFLGELVASIFAKFVSPDERLDLSKARPLMSAVRQDRLLFVPFGDDELALADALGLTGGVPDPVGQDFLAVSHLNGGPNKLDAYMQRDVSYLVDVDPTTGELDAVVEVTLTNNAPPGLSKYAANNSHGYAHGTNRVVVVVHTPHDVVAWNGGDEPELTRSWREFGWQRHEQVVVVPRGQTRTVSLELTGQINAGDYLLDIGHQPLVLNDALTIEVSPSTGTYGNPLSGADRSFEAAFDLTQDTHLSATWTPAAEPLPARMVGG